MCQLHLISEPGAGLKVLEEQSGDAEVVLQLLNVLVYLCCSKALVHRYKIRGQRNQWLCVPRKSVSYIRVPLEEFWPRAGDLTARVL